MMKKYSTPNFEVKSYEVETVITSSNIFSNETGDNNEKSTVRTVNYTEIFGN